MELQPRVRFICSDARYTDIPSPAPASKFLPTWFTTMPREVSTRPGMTTAKACIPFYEALTTGWIIPMWADLTIHRSEGPNGVPSYRFESDCEEPPVDLHPPEQIGDQHPCHPVGPLKLISPWIIETPPGYSVLISPPWNRPELVTEALTGVVQSDKYFKPINFPFYLRGNSSTHELKRGTPVVQVVPFLRGSMISDYKVATASSVEQLAQKELESAMEEMPSVYRKKMWTPTGRELPDR